LKTPEKEKQALSAGGLHLHPTMLPLYFLSYLLINPIYTHMFCLVSSMWECKDQGLLKTPFCHQ
jgi:hypothetical protein